MRWLLALSVLLAAPLTGCVRDFDDPGPENHVSLRGIDVAAPEVTTGTVTLLVNMSLDNRNARSEPVHLVVKAFDANTGFLVETQRTRNMTLGEDKTVPVELRLHVPRKSGYRIEVEVFEGGRIVETGRVTVRNVDALEPTVHETALAVEQLEFIVRNVSASRVQIEAQVYLTNEGAEPSRPLRLQAKARDVDTGLLADQAWGTVPVVEPGATRIHAVNLTVPEDHNYVVEATLWDGNFTVEKGQGTVQLLPKMTKKANEEIVVSDPKIEDFVRERGDQEGRERAADRPSGAREAVSETPGPGALAALAAIAGAAALLARRRWT